MCQTAFAKVLLGVFSFMILSLMVFAAVNHIQDFMMERKYLKIEISRTRGREKENWESLLRKSYLHFFLSFFSIG